MKTAEVIVHIINWLNEYTDKAGTNGFVVGVSGGIDSAVTSTLAAKTGRPTLCLEMPIHQASSQDSRARRHIDELKNQYSNVNSIRTDLTPVFDTFVDTMPRVNIEEDRFLTLANSRARLRMTTLYYFAGLYNYLVAGTGNKVEDFGVGFFTKYGDGGVDLSPIADLNKSEVYELGKVLEINQEIIAAKPTDGLWGDDRSDEDQLGASYHELEWAMDYKEIDHKNNSADSDELSDRQNEVLNIFNRFNTANQHKMQPIPVCDIPDALRN